MEERTDFDKFPDCGQWLLNLESYKSWEAGNSEVLWISGTGKRHISNDVAVLTSLVGTGKTSLM
jgi:hypothetical protein